MNTNSIPHQSVKLQINQEFKNLIPPLSADEYKGLEANIIKDGCREALVVRHKSRVPYNFVKEIPEGAIEFQKDYFVCQDGSFYSIAFKKMTGIIKLHPRKNQKGYLRIDVYGESCYVHRIVAKCFVNNPNGYVEVNHINCNKGDNGASNLEWCTHKQNQKHAFSQGRITKDHLSMIGKIGGANRAVTSIPRV